jgi:hypothetical protein
MTPDRYEDIAYELNHELGLAEAREINRRARWAQGQREEEGSGRQMTVEIPLTKGYVALVDDADRVLAVGRWQAIERPRTTYAVHTLKRGAVSLHTFLTGYALTDHINLDGLDNRRANLRPATHAENLRNRGRQTNNSSGFKGVTWNKRSRKWQAQIGVDRGKRYLGNFVDPEDAARAYDLAARDLHGEFARLNFPSGQTVA